MSEQVEKEIECISQSIKEMDSVLALILKEIYFIKEKVVSLEEIYEGTESSLNNMLGDSIKGIDGVLSNNSELVEDLLGKKDALKNLGSMLENYKTSFKNDK